MGNIYRKHSHIIVVGVDGAGSFIKDADTPNIDRIFANGAVTYNAVYLTFAALGLLMLIFDFSFILPDGVANIIDTRWKGINSFNIFKIFGAHFLTL